MDLIWKKFVKTDLFLNAFFYSFFEEFKFHWNWLHSFLNLMFDIMPSTWNCLPIFGRLNKQKDFCISKRKKLQSFELYLCIIFLMDLKYEYQFKFCERKRCNFFSFVDFFAFLHFFKLIEKFWLNFNGMKCTSIKSWK